MKYGLLTLMVGPSGAGKSTWLQSMQALQCGIRPSHVISSDEIRHDLCGDFRDQSRNKEVFDVLHGLVAERIKYGLPCTVDATNIKIRDRLMLTEALTSKGDHPCRYIVLNRSMEEKRKHGGWRNNLDIDLIGRHEEIFQANLRDILAGDWRHVPVNVVDLRLYK